jgi:hypothetical protein
LVGGAVAQVVIDHNTVERLGAHGLFELRAGLESRNLHICSAASNGLGY